MKTLRTLALLLVCMLFSTATQATTITGYVYSCIIDSSGESRGGPEGDLWVSWELFYDGNSIGTGFGQTESDGSFSFTHGQSLTNLHSITLSVTSTGESWDFDWDAMVGEWILQIGGNPTWYCEAFWDSSNGFELRYSNDWTP